MKKKIIVGVCIILLSIITFIYIYSQNSKTTTNIVSYPNVIENYVDANTNTISYTNPTSTYSFDYPDTWEFVPKREDMGLRPKAYGGFTKNEIVTILYFEGKGVDLKTWAKTYDGGLDEEWIEKNVYGKDALFYNYSSDSLDNYIYYFSNGVDAVKVMFRKTNTMASDGHYNNSQYENDFNKILESFKFTK